MFGNGFFVLNAFQIIPSLTPISQFGHSGHKRSFTALFYMKSTVYSPTIYVYICAAFMPNIRAKSYVFSLCISNRFGKFQVVSEIQQFSENKFLRNHPDMPQNRQILRHIWRKMFLENCYISETTWNFPKRYEMQRVITLNMILPEYWA